MHYACVLWGAGIMRKALCFSYIRDTMSDNFNHGNEQNSNKRFRRSSVLMNIRYRLAIKQAIHAQAVTDNGKADI